MKQFIHNVLYCQQPSSIRHQAAAAFVLSLATYLIFFVFSQDKTPGHMEIIEDGPELESPEPESPESEMAYALSVLLAELGEQSTGENEVSRGKFSATYPPTLPNPVTWNYIEWLRELSNLRLVFDLNEFEATVDTIPQRDKPYIQMVTFTDKQFRDFFENQVPSLRKSLQGGYRGDTSGSQERIEAFQNLFSHMRNERPTILPRNPNVRTQWAAINKHITDYGLFRHIPHDWTTSTDDISRQVVNLQLSYADVYFVFAASRYLADRVIQTQKLGGDLDTLAATMIKAKILRREPTREQTADLPGIPQRHNAGIEAAEREIDGFFNQPDRATRAAMEWRGPLLLPGANAKNETPGFENSYDQERYFEQLYRELHAQNDGQRVSDLLSQAPRGNLSVQQIRTMLSPPDEVLKMLSVHATRGESAHAQWIARHEREAHERGFIKPNETLYQTLRARVQSSRFFNRDEAMRKNLLAAIDKAFANVAASSVNSPPPSAKKTKEQLAADKNKGREQINKYYEYLNRTNSRSTRRGITAEEFEEAARNHSIGRNAKAD